MNASHRPDRAGRAMLIAACMVQIVVGTALALTTLPFCDEGFYGVPAHVLSVTGNLRNPVLESAGIAYLRGIDRSFYWMAPMGMVFQAAAFRVAGFGLLIQRELSVICGLGAILFSYLFLRRLVEERVAALAAMLLSTDFVFTALGSRGRSDMISLCFTMAALAAYMRYRERHLALAFAAASTLSALSGMVHPNGGIAALASLMVLIPYLDRTQIRWRHLAIAAACFGVLGATWGLYIAKAPDLFAAQFFGNFLNRYHGSMTLTRLLRGEVSRYMIGYGLENSHGLRLLRFLLPGSYLAAILLCTLSRKVRRQSGGVLLMFVAVSLSLMFLEGSKQGWYLVHLTPFLAAFLAIAANHLWQGGNTTARIFAATPAIMVLLEITNYAYLVHNRNLQRLYQPAVAFLNANVGPRDLVFGSSEFYFGMLCRSCLRDDAALGANSARRANYIVLDPNYKGLLDQLRERDPGVYGEIQHRLSAEYRTVFHNLNYEVLKRRVPSL